MAPRRPPGWNLETALASPSFTPRGQDLPALVELLGGSDDQLAAAERGIGRLGPTIAADLEKHARAAAAPLRGRLVRVLGQLAGAQPDLVVSLVAWSADAEPKARRNAIIALGKLADPRSDARLRQLVTAADTSPPDRRSAVDALGKVGGPDALAALETVRPGDDAELARLLARSRVRLTRTAGRGTAPSEIDTRAAPARPLPFRLSCRTGLEELLADELPGTRVAGSGAVTGELSGPLGDLFRARLFLEIGFPLPRQSLQQADKGDPVPALVRALVSDEAAAIFAAFTRGPARYRVAWGDGGHHRAATLKLAIAAAAVRPELVNDPTGSSWEARLGLRSGDVEVVLVPRAPDPRFTYRKRDVPAASHPTIAAALARVAGARADDVVWDPFVGSGSELVERARLGPYRALAGSDLDERALAAAAENLAAAGVTADLSRRDALGAPPPGTTLILTNPPMGRRLLRQPGAAARLLLGLLDAAGPALAPGSRIAWLSPDGEATAAHAARAGFRVAMRRPVDLGGFSAELQLLVATSPRRPSTSAAPRSRG